MYYKGEKGSKSIEYWIKDNITIGSERGKGWYPSIIKKKTPVVSTPAPKYEYKLIHNISAGDVFVYKNYGFVQPVIVAKNYPTGYILLGLSKKLAKFSNEPLEGKETIDYLNNHKYIFITNISDKITKTLDMATKLVAGS